MVLVIDDDEDLRDSVSDLLTQKGYDVKTAADGRAGLTALSTGRPCIVLLDLVMPGMDGWTFLKQVQADPRLAAIPIVIASAHAATHAPDDVAAVLRKPFDLDELLELVARFCGPAQLPA